MTSIRLSGMPTLRVSDGDVAKVFYDGFLGFTVDWEHYHAEGAPVYMQVSRDGMVLHLSENSRFPERVIVLVETHGIDELHRELARKAGPRDVPAVSKTAW